MSKVILVTSGKGGTGKTTVTQFLGRALAASGRNVLLLELDSGLRGMDLMLGVSDRVVYDVSDVLRGACKPARAITAVPTANGNLHYIAAAADRKFIADRGNLALLLRGFAGVYDFLLLDTAAGLGRDIDVAAGVADTALVVTNADRVSARGAAAVAAGLPCPARLVINRFRRGNLVPDMPTLDSVIDAAGVQLISVIPFDSAIPAAESAGSPLPASSPAWGEIADLARRLLGERVPLNQKRLIKT